MTRRKKILYIYTHINYLYIYIYKRAQDIVVFIYWTMNMKKSRNNDILF